MLLVFILFIFILLVVLFVRIKFIIAIHENKYKGKIVFSVFGIPLVWITIKKNKKSNKQTYNLIKDVYKEGGLYFEKLNLKVELSTKDAMLTSSIVSFISMGIPILLRLGKINVNQKRFFYKISSSFKNKNILNIDLDCIVSANLRHIIYMLIKEWRRDKNGRKASN